MFAIQAIASYHPLFASFPIIFFTAALFCDFIHFFNRPKALNAGHWMVILAVLAYIPAMITGLAAASFLEPETLYLPKHRSLSYYTAFFGSLYAGLRIAVMKWKFDFKPLHFIGLSVLMVALVSWASDFGGLVVQAQKTAGQKVHYT